MRPRPPLRARRPGAGSSCDLPRLGFPSQSPRDLGLYRIEGDSFHATGTLEQRGQVLRSALLLSGAALCLVTWATRGRPARAAAPSPARSRSSDSSWAPPTCSDQRAGRRTVGCSNAERPRQHWIVVSIVFG